MSKTNKKESTDDKIIAMFRTQVIYFIIAISLLSVGSGAFITSALFAKSMTECLIMTGCALGTWLYTLKILISVHFYLEKTFKYLLNATPDPVDDSKENQV